MIHRGFPFFFFIWMINIFQISCAPHSGHSGGCGPKAPYLIADVTAIDGNPNSKIDITIKKPSIGSINIIFNLQVNRPIDTCGQCYTGPITLFLDNPPTGVSASFDPATLPEYPQRNPPWQFQNAKIVIDNSVNVGKFQLYQFVKAKEYDLKLYWSSYIIITE